MGVAGRIGHMVPIRFPAAPLCGVPVFVPSLRTAMIESGTVETGDESMKDLVEFIAKSLADKPEEVEVREVEGDQVRAGTACGQGRSGENHRQAGAHGPCLAYNCQCGVRQGANAASA